MNRLVIAVVMISVLSASLYCSTLPAENQLVKMQIEVKLANDLYTQFYGEWKLDVFNNIAEGKAVHKIRMESILDELGITHPLESSFNRGKLDDPDMQTLYDALLLKGRESETKALLACAFLEEQMYGDLNECLLILSDNKSRKIIRQMILTTGYHLRELVKTLNRSGELYAPQLLLESEFDNIMGSGKEIVTTIQD